MRDSLRALEERRLLHNFLAWRENARLVKELGAYRTLNRELTLGSTQSPSVTLAENGVLERRVAQEPGVLAVFFADRLPGWMASCASCRSRRHAAFRRLE